MRSAEATWEQEYEALAAMLRGAPRVPWSAPRSAAARRAAAHELVRALEDSARLARDEPARALWTDALQRAREIALAVETSSAA